ncbi:YidH family protein [Rufibacter sp. XAAS-G3-1]|uniref:YidH family protein n=1 Tax=Rufibacter sp. XAAS-G3-1 TaxID=2729134 RepID=UPI0015E7C697|nr:DUF202 domain-containing protein [Rufibacter sp. XAAS-G3-1]
MEYEFNMAPELREEVRKELKVKEKANAEIKDALAIERTTFANERTFLAYLRTSLSLVIVGISLHQFFNTALSMWVAVFLIPLGVVIGAIGYRKFTQKRAFIRRKRDAYVPAKQMLALLKAEKANQLHVSR